MEGMKEGNEEGKVELDGVNVVVGKFVGFSDGFIVGSLDDNEEGRKDVLGVLDGVPEGSIVGLLLRSIDGDEENDGASVILTSLNSLFTIDDLETSSPLFA